MLASFSWFDHLLLVVISVGTIWKALDDFYHRGERAQQAVTGPASLQTKLEELTKKVEGLVEGLKSFEKLANTINEEASQRHTAIQKRLGEIEYALKLVQERDLHELQETVASLLTASDDSLARDHDLAGFLNNLVLAMRTPDGLANLKAFEFRSREREGRPRPRV